MTLLVAWILGCCGWAALMDENRVRRQEAGLGHDTEAAVAGKGFVAALGVDASRCKLAGRDTGRTNLTGQDVRLVLEGMQQRSVLRGMQKQHQQQG